MISCRRMCEDDNGVKIYYHNRSHVGVRKKVGSYGGGMDIYASCSHTVDIDYATQYEQGSKVTDVTIWVAPLMNYTLNANTSQPIQSTLISLSLVGESLLWYGSRLLSTAILDNLARASKFMPVPVIIP